MKPVHYDVDAIRKDGAETAARLIELALALARNDQDRAFTRAQARLDTASTELMATQAQLLNEGVPPEIMAAAVGVVLGSMVAGQTRQFAAAGLAEQMLHYFDIAKTDPADAGAVTLPDSVFAPIEGGNA